MTFVRETGTREATNSESLGLACTSETLAMLADMDGWLKSGEEEVGAKQLWLGG